MLVLLGFNTQTLKFLNAVAVATALNALMLAVTSIKSYPSLVVRDYYIMYGVEES